MLLTWRWFPGACALGVGLLLKMGAPVVATLAGVAVAALVTWYRADRSP